jgi:alpha-maltose-1-phosphate synthase
MSAAIYYHPEAYTTRGPKLMGRNAAGESFLRGFLAYSQSPEFWIQVQKAEHAQHFVQTLQFLGINKKTRVVDQTSLINLKNPGVVYHAGPGIGEYARHRSFFGNGAWSLCGITHTTSSAGAMDSLASLITAPVYPWDAVICTSRAVKDHVTHILRAQTDYMKDRLGVTKIVLPQLPVIPLGIHTADFCFTPAQRQQARTSLGVDDDTLVTVFVGRLSFHAKAHPLAMYQALEIAAQKTGKKVVLVECGWFANEYIQNAYTEAAKQYCPHVQVIHLDGRSAENRTTAWAGADVFCSLSDNFQETFGITPIEAMAAGLPVVVSDWDGYRDTVRHGVDGFRIDTLIPSAGLGQDLAQRHALGIDNYDSYCGYTCSFVAVNIQAASQALIDLFESPERRKAMGAAARAQAQAVYDWAHIIPAYEDLWRELGQIRAKEKTSARSVRPAPWPERLDPFSAFQGYATSILTPDSRVRRMEPQADVAQEQLAALIKLAMLNFAGVVLPSKQELAGMVAAADTVGQPARHLVAHVDDERKALAFRGIAWLIKIGLLTIATE